MAEPHHELSDRRAFARTSRYSVIVLASFAVVIACFGASTLYADLRMRDVATQSEGISANSVPSVVHLSEIRAILHDLDEVTAPRAPPGEVPIATTLSHLRSARVLYEALPTSAEERAMWAPIRAELDAVETHAELLTSKLHAANGATDWLLESRTHLRERAARIDAELRRLIEFNAVQGRNKMAHLDAERRRISLVAFTLDAVSLLVSIALAVLAARTVQRYTGLVERRADELEIFASRVAHDVRGPLTPALGALEMARKKLPKEHELGPMLDRGVRSVRLVESIVDGLLVFARAGAQPEPGAYADFRRAVEEVLSECQSYATARRVDLRAEPVPEVAVACAPGLLAGVLSNLVRNAIKYVDQDEPRQVTVHTVLEKDVVRCEVLDTGPGIPPAMAKAIFLPHVRLDRRASGLGLGLATVERVVRAHGGQVGVSPNPKGRGSRFWFELPQATDVR